MNKKDNELEFTEAMLLMLSGEFSERDEAYWKEYIANQPEKAEEIKAIQATLQSYSELPSKDAPEVVIQNLAGESKKLLSEREAGRPAMPSGWARIKNRLVEIAQTPLSFPKVATTGLAVILVGVLLLFWPTTSNKTIDWDDTAFERQAAKLDSALAFELENVTEQQEEFLVDELNMFDENLETLSEEIAYLANDIETTEL